MVEHMGTDVTDAEGRAQEQPRRVALLEIDADQHARNRDRQRRRDAEQPALQAVAHHRHGRRPPPLRNRGGGKHAERDHEDVVQDGDEEQQRPPRRSARVRGAAHRHSEADPQKRQRPQRQGEHHPGGDAQQDALPEQRHGPQIVGGAPQPAAVRPDERRVRRILEQQEPGAAHNVGAPVHWLGETEPEAKPPHHDAFACSNSFFRASATLCAASGGTSWYTWNFCRYVPRPWVSECSVVA